MQCTTEPIVLVHSSQIRHVCLNRFSTLRTFRELQMIRHCFLREGVFRSTLVLMAIGLILDIFLLLISFYRAACNADAVL